MTTTPTLDAAAGLVRTRTRAGDPHAVGFAVTGPAGAVEVWRLQHERLLRFADGWAGGLELHHRDPDGLYCPVLGGGCRTESSSAALGWFEARGLWGAAVYPVLEELYTSRWG